MKKKLWLFGLFLLLLIPFNVKAYLYTGARVDYSNMRSKGWLTSWPANGSDYVVGVHPNSKHAIRQYMWFHEIFDENGSSRYSVLCASIGKKAGVPETSDINLDIVGNLDNITNSEGQALTSQQKELVRDLLVNGYHYDVTNTKNLDLIVNSKEDTFSLYSMQILLWEIIEGGRTSFETVAPNYNPANSAYNLFFAPNGGSGNTAGTLHYYYKKIVNDVYAATHPTDAPAFNTETYTMTWDTSNKRYSVNVKGLGKYTSCKSSDGNVKLTSTNNGSGLTLTSTKKVNNATITCSYSVGSGTQDYFYYFRFRPTGNCYPDGSCQNLVYGSGKKVYSKSFKVKSEGTSIKIRKIGMDKKNLSGAKFKLTHVTNSNYSVTITGNDSNATTLERSGEYVVSETSAPAGYEKVKDFNIKIDATSGKVTDCTNKGKNAANNMTCLGGQVEVTVSNGVINLSVLDVAKNFKIKKINQDNKEIKGATFQIKNSKNQVMKFTLYDSKIFGYNASGNITNIQMSNSSTYPIALLPEGEYKLVETAVPAPYKLSSKESENTTKFKINASRDLFVYDETQKTYVAAVDATIKVKNYETMFLVKKIGNGKPLKGVKFLLYAADKTTEIKSTMDHSGAYIYAEDQASAAPTQYITNDTGYVRVNGLPVGTYYFREIETVGDYVLPEGDDAYTKFVLDITKNGATVNGSSSSKTIVISNTKSSFNFYKIDEDGNYLTTGKFKLQRYDTEKNRYVDVKLKQIQNDGTYDENADIFMEDAKGKVQFGLTNGIATFIEMRSSTTYRIVETVAPEGYVKQSASDTATVSIDARGNASGLLVLTNQKVLKEDGQAQAELIINIQTGQTRVKYAIIIGSIIVILGALFIIQRRKK